MHGIYFYLSLFSCTNVEINCQWYRLCMEQGNEELELSLEAIHTPTIVPYEAEARVRFFVEIDWLGTSFELYWS